MPYVNPYLVWHQLKKKQHLQHIWKPENHFKTCFESESNPWFNFITLTEHKKTCNKCLKPNKRKYMSPIFAMVWIEWKVVYCNKHIIIESQAIWEQSHDETYNSKIGTTYLASIFSFLLTMGKRLKLVLIVLDLILGTTTRMVCAVQSLVMLLLAVN